MRTISVTGSGTAEVVPDIARISVGVAARGREATEASSRAAEQMQAVIDALVGAGVAEADIQTRRLLLAHAGVHYAERSSGRKGAGPETAWRMSKAGNAHVRDTDLRHVEAWMRLAHPTLDGLSRSEFVRAMYAALGQVQDAGPEESEALAASFGL